MANVSPVLEQKPYSSVKGYHGFPQDHILNWTDALGFLLPVYYDRLNPGDKVRIKTFWRTTTKELSSPAMIDITERIEWFAVPLHQLYKLFGSKFYGIQDFESDYYQNYIGATPPINDYLPIVSNSSLNGFLTGLANYYMSPEESYQYYLDNLVDATVYSDTVRLCNALGIGKNLLYGSTDSGFIFDSSNPITGSIHPFFFAAYQKIWYDVYRITDRVVNYPQAYNFDSVVGTTSITAAVPTARYDKLFKLHRRPYNKDYFTSQLVSPVQGGADIGMLGYDLTAVNQWLTGLTSISTVIPSSSTLLPSGVTAASSSSPTTVRPTGTTSSAAITKQDASLQSTSLTSPANIRSVFAIEKLLEVTRRAKKHYDMQTLAHFGIKVPQGISGEVYRLGVESQSLEVNRVVSTADTSGAALGDLAGYGFSNTSPTKDDKYITFEAPCHCILMGIYSAEPLISYPDEGQDKNNTLVMASDWYKPEFDSLGMQPLFGYEVSFGYAVNNSAILGWQSRYAEQKVKYSKSIAGMSTTYFADWVINRDPSLLALLAVQTPGIYTNSWFYVSPNDMDKVLLNYFSATVANKDPNLVFASDYLVHQAYFDVIKSSKMSIHGVPNL